MLEVSPQTYAEIWLALRKAGLEGALQADHNEGVVLDLHGVALQVERCPCGNRLNYYREGALQRKCGVCSGFERQKA